MKTELTELFSVQFEQAVLAGLMTIDLLFDLVSDKLSEQVFYAERHRIIFRAIKTLAVSGEKYDAILVNDWITKNQLSKESGGESYLMQLLAESPASLYNTPTYVEKLKDLHYRRSAESALKIALEAVRVDFNTNAADTIAKASDEMITSMQVNAKQDDIVGAHNATIQMIDKLLAMEFKGVETGFKELDSHIGGIANGNLIVIAGGSSSGKSMLAANISQVLMDTTLKTALFFSMEMPVDQVTFRTVCSLASLPMDLMKSNHYSTEQWSKFQHMSDVWMTKPFLIDAGSQTIESIKMKSRRVMRESKGMSCIVVDYIQLMSGGDSKGSNRTNEIDKITRGLKALALELDIPVIALSQFKRTANRPTIADLRESGSIEQDADIVLMIYHDDKGKSELVIGKQRQGPRNISMPIFFNGAMARFENPYQQQGSI